MRIRICLLLAVLIPAAHPAWGHGRILTHVTADVREERARVVINAAWIDLAAAAGAEFVEFTALPPEQRNKVLRKGMLLFAERIFLFDQEGQKLTPRPPVLDLPENGGPLPPPGPDQRQGRISLEYPFERPPAELMFWQRFGTAQPNQLYPVDDHHSTLYHHDFSEDQPPMVPIQSILTIRQNGEMALLPAEFGPGFPVRFPFAWEDEFVPIAHRDSLRSAAARAENRPPNGRITIEGGKVTWRILVPVETLDQTLGDQWSRGQEWDALRVRLVENVSLAVNGQKAEPEAASFGTHPMTVMSVLHRRPLETDSARAGMAVLEITRSVSEPPREVEAGWTLFGKGMGSLYTDIFEEGEPVGFSTLSPANPRARYPVQP